MKGIYIWIYGICQSCKVDVQMFADPPPRSKYAIKGVQANCLHPLRGFSQVRSVTSHGSAIASWICNEIERVWKRCKVAAKLIKHLWSPLITFDHLWSRLQRVKPETFWPFAGEAAVFFCNHAAEAQHCFFSWSNLWCGNVYKYAMIHYHYYFMWIGWQNFKRHLWIPPGRKGRNGQLEAQCSLDAESCVGHVTPTFHIFCCTGEGYYMGGFHKWGYPFSSS